MKTVTVHASSSYQILIGKGLLSETGSRFRSLLPSARAAVITDSNVAPLYLAQIQNSLEAAGIRQIPPFIFSAGEQQKNASTYLGILGHLARHHMTRSDAVIALGGGVTGDLAGFAAATYLRGIPYIQIPTTLLAAVDSSVGGKTAIDLPEGKNLAGAFYQPRLVLCDPDTLFTLPEHFFRDGCAEVIKYAVLYDPELFALLEKDGLSFDRETVIQKCVEWKALAVRKDEFDRGEREKLNLGHTIGHAAEKVSGFTLSHGYAVAAGLAAMVRTAARYGYCSQGSARRILGLLESFGFPTVLPYDADTLYQAALSDKKLRGSRIDLIVPKKIGDCAVLPIPAEQLLSVIQTGLIP